VDQDQLDLLVRADDEDIADGLLSAGVRDLASPEVEAGSIPHSFATVG
jgi:hypothetical protein